MNHSDKRKFRRDLHLPVAGMSMRVRDKAELYRLFYSQSYARAVVADSQLKVRRSWPPEIMKQGGSRYYSSVLSPALSLQEASVHFAFSLKRRRGCFLLFPHGTPCAEYIITIPFWPTMYSPMGSKPLLRCTASAKLKNTPSMSSRLDQTTKTVWPLGRGVVALNSRQFVTATFTIPPDFSVAASSSTLTVKRGGQVSEVLNLPAQGGFSATIALTCSVSSGSAPMPQCGVSPASVTPDKTATLTVSASALSASAVVPLFEPGARLYATWLPLGLLGCGAVNAFDKKRRRLWALFFLLIAVAILPAACGGGSVTTPPPQNYTVTVTATSGAIQHSTAISVTVQ